MNSDVRFGLESADERTIVAVTQNLVGKSLHDVTGIDSLDSFSSEENPLEVAMIQYISNYPEPLREHIDASRNTLSVKAIPVKVSKNVRLVANDRLTLEKIDFFDALLESWNTSPILKQYRKLILIAYLYEPGTNPVDYVIQFANLWSMSNEDIYTIQRD